MTTPARAATNLEVLAEAFPLHFQLIVERTHEAAPPRSVETLQEPFKSYSPQGLLFSLFIWDETPEGLAYWCALAYGDKPGVDIAIVEKPDA